MQVFLNHFTSRRWLGACLPDTSYHETKWSLDTTQKVSGAFQIELSADTSFSTHMPIVMPNVLKEREDEKYGIEAQGK